MELKVQNTVSVSVSLHQLKVNCEVKRHVHSLLRIARTKYGRLLETRLHILFVFLPSAQG